MKIKCFQVYKIKMNRMQYKINLNKIRIRMKNNNFHLKRVEH